jgi:molybdate transport system regulatory protein
MNRCFQEPLVEALRGGFGNGGAKLTSAGKAALKLYERLEKETLAATRQTRRQLAAMQKRNPS